MPIDVCLLQNHLLKRLSFLHWTTFAPLSIISLAYLNSFFSFFHWSMYLSINSTLNFCRYTLSLKTGGMIPHISFFFFKIVLANSRFMPFYVNLRISLSMCKNKTKQKLGNNRHLHCFEFLNPWTWNIFLSIYILFDFFHQHFIIFSIQILYMLY